MLLELMKINNISMTDLCKELDVAPSRIYHWNKKGIYKSDRCWNKLHAMFPSLKPREERTTAKGTTDQRVKNQRPKKEFILANEDKPVYKEERRLSEIFPNIQFKSTK